MARRLLGELLLERGVVRKPQLDLALSRQKAAGRRIGSMLVEMGLAREPDVLEALADQLGVPSVDLGFARIAAAELDAVPEAFARRHGVLPFRALPDRLQAAVIDPTDRAAVTALARMAARPVDPHVALEADLVRAVDGAYRARREGAPEWMGARAHAAADLDVEIDFDAVRAAEGRPGEFATPPPAVALPPPAATTPPPAPTTPGARVAPVAAPPPAPTTPGARVAPVAAPPPAEPMHEDSGSIPIETVVESLDSAVAAEPQADATAVATVLVADVSPEGRGTLASILRARPVTLREASDGNAALAIACDESPDLIVVDPDLPGLHGFELCRRLRENPATERISVVVVSARWRGWRVAQDLRDLYGVAAFLDKPVRAEWLLRAVDLAIGLEPPKNGAPALAAAAAHKEALAEQKAGRVAAAVQRMREAVRLDPLSAPLRSQMAALLLRAGAAYEAMQELEEAADLDVSPSVLKSLALLYEKRGFRGKAVETWERALRAASAPPDRDEIRKKLAELLDR